MDPCILNAVGPKQVPKGPWDDQRPIVVLLQVNKSDRPLEDLTSNKR